MALHGEIRINGQEIGYWSARRLADVWPVPADMVNEYETTLKIDGKVTTGRVTHRYGDGAAVLAAKVLGA